ncbi:MAG: PAN domain-containing protein, partial [Methanotrichaceae archaeon]|nr:PAN domain-containing protein [Methanotrichaceae archaeon]
MTSTILLASLILMATDLAGSVLTFVGDPAVCAWSDDRTREFYSDFPFRIYSSIDVFVRCSNDTLMRKHWDGTTWAAHYELIEINVNGRSQPALSSPSAVQRGRDIIDVFTTDGINVFRTWWDGRSWRSEAIQNMGEMISSAPAASSWDSDRIDLFVIGADGNLWHKFFEENRGWDRQWENLGRPFGHQLRSDPAAASIGPGCIDVVVLTENGYYHKRYDRYRTTEDELHNRGWKEWTSIPGAQFGYDKRACITSPILIGAPNCAGYTYFFAVDNHGHLAKGDYHLSRTSALVGENLPEDIEYGRMGISRLTPIMGSAPAVVGYWNPTHIKEYPPVGPQPLVHIPPAAIWIVFYRSPSDSTLWYMGCDASGDCGGRLGYEGRSVPDSSDILYQPSGEEEPVTVTVLLPKIILDNNTNLPGSDYKNLELSTADPNICAYQCSGDSACKAFTYVKPGYQGPKAQCWLKNVVPSQVQDECCVSGIKGETNAWTSAETPEVVQQPEPSQPEVAA